MEGLAVDFKVSDVVAVSVTRSLGVGLACAFCAHARINARKIQ